MSILIKGMEMPKCCESCPCKTADAFGGLGCQATGYIPLRKANQDRPDNCPLVPVPAHGRLIDADVLVDCLATLLQFPSNLVNGQWIVNTLREQPTIIPAEEGE